VILAEDPSTLAKMIGAMQHAPIGFLLAWNSRTTRSMSSFTVILEESIANVDKFLAAPKPPGKNKASKLAA
jgi:hypothetical protein